MWCKQIGSYEDAKGLSPEDAFEEITGVPAYTYTIKANNRETIRNVLSNSLKNRYWVVLVARNGLADFHNRQVFYLKERTQNGYNIISPYANFKHRKSEQKIRGETTIGE